MTVETLGRAYDVYRRTATSRSALLLVLANVIPLVGVLFLDWSLLTILVIYWLENGIVGIWNVPKIVMAQGSILPRLPELSAAAALAATGSPARAAALQEQWRAARAAQDALLAQTPADPASAAPRARPGFLTPQTAARLSLIPRSGLAMFFLFHYGMFWLVHGIFVFALPALAGGEPSFGTCFDATGFPIECQSGGAFGDVVWSSVLIGGIALFISHAASFFLNYVGRGEYITASAPGQMARVYGRVVVLHVTIIVGSILAAFLDAPIGALLVLVVLKTAFDLGLHFREHRTAGPTLAAQAPAA